MLRTIFEERLQEIETYLDFLCVLEKQVTEGAPKIGAVSISAQQQKILYSSVYLQLYNLVEATVTWCIEAVCSAAAEGGKWIPADLTENLRREWVRTHAKTHLAMNADKRLDKTVDMSNLLVQTVPITNWSIQVSGGNWDDVDIEKVSHRIGCQMSLTSDVISNIKRPMRDNKGALRLIKSLRNDLAHGSLSFSECGEGITVSELTDLKTKTAKYLSEVISAFDVYITRYEFLRADKRPHVADINE